MTYTCSEYTCSFTDQSTDPDGTVVSWLWDFGDLTPTSTEQNPPPHTYASGPFYIVSLTVTDDKGATDTLYRDIFVPAVDVGLTLEAQGFKEKGQKRTELQWTYPVPGSVTGFVDIWRNGSLIRENLNEEVHGTTYTDLIGRGGESVYTYKVCVAQTGGACSNEVTVTF